MAAGYFMVLLFLASLPALISAQDRTALFIVGGFDTERDGAGEVRDEAEIFGCGGPASTTLNPFPYSIHAGAARFWEGGDRLVVCGGRRCEGVICTSLTQECYQLDTDGTEGGERWTFFANMTQRRWYHMLTEQPLAPSPDAGITAADPEPHLIALGYQDQSDYFDPASGQWLPYQTEPGLNWLTVNCFAEMDGVLYSMSRSLEALYADEWEEETLVDELPPPLYTPGRCVGAEINGEKGILTRRGFFYNLEREEFQPVSAPPHVPVAESVNEMYSWGGSPAMVGVPYCEPSGGDGGDLNCRETLVFAYEEGGDEWRLRGEMLLSRRDHLVAEVPGEFCQRLGLDLPPQTTTAPDGPAFGDDDDNDDEDEDGASDMFPGAVSLLLAAAAAIVIAH